MWIPNIINICYLTHLNINKIMYVQHLLEIKNFMRIKSGY